MQTYRQKRQQKSDLGFRRNIILFVYVIAWGQGQLRESQERAIISLQPFVRSKASSKFFQNLKQMNRCGKLISA